MAIFIFNFLAIIFHSCLAFIRDLAYHFIREDPRLHACIVCASISCPDVRTTAYNPSTIDDQMTDQMKNFLQNNKKGQHYLRRSDVIIGMVIV